MGNVIPFPKTMAHHFVVSDEIQALLLELQAQALDVARKHKVALEAGPHAPLEEHVDFYQAHAVYQETLEKLSDEVTNLACATVWSEDF